MKSAYQDALIVGLEQLNCCIVYRLDLDQSGGMGESIRVPVEIVDQIDDAIGSQLIGPYAHFREVLLPNTDGSIGEKVPEPRGLILKLGAEPGEHEHAKRKCRRSDERPNGGRSDVVVPGIVGGSQKGGVSQDVEANAASDEQAADHPDDRERSRTGGGAAGRTDDRRRDDDYGSRHREQHSGVLTSGQHLDPGNGCNEGRGTRLDQEVGLLEYNARKAEQNEGNRRSGGYQTD